MVLARSVTGGGAAVGCRDLGAVCAGASWGDSAIGPLTSADGGHANQEPPGSMDGGEHGLLATGGGELAGSGRKLPSSTPVALTMEQQPQMQVSNPLSLSFDALHAESYETLRQER